VKFHIWGPVKALLISTVLRGAVHPIFQETSYVSGCNPSQTKFDEFGETDETEKVDPGQLHNLLVPPRHFAKELYGRAGYFSVPCWTLVDETAISVQGNSWFSTPI
jgi:hypothetical protein